MILSVVENLLKESMGLNISSIGVSTLSNAIKRRKKALGMADDYTYVSYLKSSASEMNYLIEEVAVNETWFFRDRIPFQSMIGFATQWLSGHRNSVLRILSLPCATGEEPYSIAIALLEAGWSHNNFQIDGVDISAKSLRTAKEALYSRHSFRGSDKKFQDKYFNQVKNGFKLDPKICNLVTFHKGNLINLAIPRSGKPYDIIFCRNLLIYLDKAAQSKAIATLDRLLTQEGLLFIGHAEPGIFTNSQFETAPYQKSFAMQKKQAGATTNDGGQEEQALPTSTAPPPQPTPREEPKHTAGERPAKSSFEVDEIIEARLLLDQKKYDEAVTLCLKLIEEKGPAADTYFWLGNILDEKGDKKEASEMLRKAVYLDPQHLDALILITSIYKNMGDMVNFHAFKRRLQRVRERLNLRG